MGGLGRVLGAHRRGGLEAFTDDRDEPCGGGARFWGKEGEENEKGQGGRSELVGMREPWAEIVALYAVGNCAGLLGTKQGCEYVCVYVWR